MVGSLDGRRIRIRLGVLFLVLVFFGIVVPAEAGPEFSGMWRQDNERSQPKRSGEVVLRIEHHDPEVTVETTIAHGSGTTRHALQKYTTNGKASISTGADGDEFQTSVIWKDASLVFSIEEHEDGRILVSKEIWSLIEDGATLRRVRERPDGEKQVLFFRLEQSVQR